ncbi:hypothetical protein [Bacillus sp. CECT 9360]|uniref:hypothetical protein n=1 Tax=Bacillus sp. CECT 9360 TaxID=2845821 RepID=UPI001E50FF9F|nr:hypothetical protein [Bacillus sp. CECT 9360]
MTLNRRGTQGGPSGFFKSWIRLEIEISNFEIRDWLQNRNSGNKSPCSGNKTSQIGNKTGISATKLETGYKIEIPATKVPVPATKLVKSATKLEFRQQNWRLATKSKFRQQKSLFWQQN